MIGSLAVLRLADGGTVVLVDVPVAAGLGGWFSARMARFKGART
jgi:hypothetical protein